MSLKSCLYFLTALGMLGIILSCNKNNSDLTAIVKTGRIAFYNLVPGGTDINFYVNGTRLNDYKIGYGGSSGYISAPSGPQSVSFKTDDSRTLLFNPATINIDTLNSSLLVTGIPGSVNTILLSDTAKADISNLNPKLRFINASSDSPAFDAVLNKVTIANKAYKSISPYARVDTGVVTFKLNLAGTSSNVISKPVTLQSRTVYTLIVFGSYKGIGNGLTYKLLTN